MDGLTTFITSAAGWPDKQDQKYNIPCISEKKICSLDTT